MILKSRRKKKEPYTVKNFFGIIEEKISLYIGKNDEKFNFILEKKNRNF